MIHCSRFLNLSAAFVRRTVRESSSVIGKCDVLSPKKYSQFCNINLHRRYNRDFRRFYGGSGGEVRKIEDDYYLRETSPGSGTFLLGATDKKFKDFKEIVYINITEEENLNKGDYLFSVEDSKTLFDFYSPLDCQIEEVNPKFLKGVDEEKLKELLESPEGEDNYLVRVTLKSD